ncbi:MAG: hypothetical protein LBM98_06820 [Oscillospiraceae bacterium]|nr:hypothetical protein [Oscillospiraceae bacterium]
MLRAANIVRILSLPALAKTAHSAGTGKDGARRRDEERPRQDEKKRRVGRDKEHSTYPVQSPVSDI